MPVRDRMAGPETGLFFPIMPNHMPWRTSMKGGGLLDGSPLRLFSVGNRRCILVRKPLPGIGNTQRLIYATIRITAQREDLQTTTVYIACEIGHPNTGFRGAGH